MSSNVQSNGPYILILVELHLIFLLIVGLGPGEIAPDGVDDESQEGDS